MTITKAQKETIEITQEACAALRSFLMNDREGTGEGYSDFILISIDTRRQIAALQAERDRLREALKPFAYLWRDALLDKPDLAPVYSFNDAVITVGHLKAAQQALDNQT